MKTRSNSTGQYLQLMLVLLLVFSSCTREQDAYNQDNGQSFIQVSTRSIYDADPDQKISGFRIMAFGHTSHVIESNVYYPNSSLVSTSIIHHMNTGTYDFVFIANEPASTSNALNGVLRLSDLDNISFPTSAISENSDLPMIHKEDDVKVLNDPEQNYRVEVNGVKYQIWNVTMERMVARFDITLHSDVGTLSDFKGITFNNIPDAIPLTGNYTGARSTTRNYTVAANPGTFLPATVPGAAWSILVSRVILPENMFTPEGNITKSVSLSLQMDGNAVSPSTTLGVDEQNSNYTIPRNKYFKVQASVKYPIEINIAASDWTNAIVDGSIFGNHILNVSTVSVNLNERNNVRVYFSSDQPNVFVEPTGLNNSGASFAVNSLCPEITGASPANFHYDSATGKGYMDLHTEISPTNSPYRMYLNAGGLRREIVVNTSVKILPTWNSRKFAGTFHRWNQRGERLISASNSGSWSASIEYPAGQSAFVVLSTSRSIDQFVNTSSPVNPEDYPVTDGVTTPISGDGQIYFRVGMTSKLASASTQPRYARIKVTNTNGISYIYVRQGEAADYIMRPTDPINSAGVVSSTRPNAVKFVPFNLTDPQKVVGNVDRGTRGYVFTDYPTQSGYLFQWGGTQSWSPTVAATSGFPEPGRTPWNQNPSWETCPPGYRRFNDGSTSAYQAPGNQSQIMISEARQSLWLNPVYVNGADNIDNELTGYYADGFFDRRRMETDVANSSLTNWRVESGPEIAYIGSVMYNPTTFASLLLPSNVFLAADGILATSAPGAYHTSSISGSNNAIILFVNNNANTIGIGGGYAKAGATIRCVAE